MELKDEYRIIATVLPPAMVLSRDEKILYLAGGGMVLALDVQPDGLLTNQRTLAQSLRPQACG